MTETTDLTQLSYEDARAMLKKWRECGVRRSEEVVEIWEHIISRSPASLGDEQWAVLEQVGNRENSRKTKKSEQNLSKNGEK